MSIQDNIHSQGVKPDPSTYGYGWVYALDIQENPPELIEREKGWLEWCATPVKAVWNLARSFFHWVASFFPYWKNKQKTFTEIEYLLPIGQTLDFLRKLSIELSKETSDKSNAEKKYKEEYKKLPKFVREGLQEIAATMLCSQGLRKKVFKNEPLFKTKAEGVKRARFILQKPENKSFYVYPIFEEYLKKMNYRVF